MTTTETFSSLTLSDGRRLSYTQHGSPADPAVLYFHGAGASALSHAPDDGGAAEAGVRLICVERPGIGGSDPQPHRRLTDWPGDVVQLVDHLGIDRFSVLGWSAGGPHALACAAALPNRVLACGVLFGAVSIGWQGWDEGVSPELAPFCTTAVESPDALRDALLPMMADPEGFSLMFLEKDASAAVLLADDRIVERVRADARRAFAQGADAMLRDVSLILSPWDFDPADIRVPVRLIYGRQDESCPVSWGARLESQISTAEMVVLDAGHNHGYDISVFRDALGSLVQVANSTA